MFAKLCAIILAFGVIGCMLLVLRQQQIEAAHEMSRVHRRLGGHERSLWRLRAEIARQSSPQQIRQSQSLFQMDWTPLVVDESPAHSTGHPEGGIEPQKEMGG